MSYKEVYLNLLYRANVTSLLAWLEDIGDCEYPTLEERLLDEHHILEEISLRRVWAE